MAVLNLDGSVFAVNRNGVKGGVQYLGTDEGKSVVLENLSKRVVKLSPSRMTEMELMSVCGADWCEENYSEFNEKKEVEEFDHRTLATDIIRGCQEIGPYIAAHERKSGVWLMSDGNLVVNGSTLWRPDGELLEHGIHDGRVYPAMGDIGFDLTTNPADTDAVARVYGALSALNWRQPLAPQLLLGFLGVAIVPAALRRRPHVLVTGPHGIGKSSILELIGNLLGRMAYRLTGPQTLAAFYQGLADTPRTVILDEFEADPSRRNARDTLELARMSYSLQEGDEGIVRGTPGGTKRSYRCYSPFLAAGISPSKMEPADVSRWVVLEAQSRKPEAALISEPEAHELGPRLARLFVSRWKTFQRNMHTLHARVVANGGDGRMADTVGVLLASYAAFVQREPLSTLDADELLAGVDIPGRIEANSIRDEQRCLEALLSKTHSFKFMVKRALVTQTLSIGESIQRVCEDPTGSPEIVAEHSRQGLRVAFDRHTGKVRLYVLNSPEHQQLRRIFAGTKWAKGGWPVVLRRLPGGEESTQRIGAGFPAAKVTAFDIPEDLCCGLNSAERE